MKKSLFLLVFLSLCFKTFDGGVEAAKPNKNLTTTASEEAQEKMILRMINKERQKYGLGALVNWDILAYYAKEHSMKMATGKVAFGHQGFDGRAKAVQKHASCHSVGENVAYCYQVNDPLQTSVDLWMKSPDHCDNILGDYCESGVGIVYNKDGYCYITQLFSKRVKK